MKKILFCILAGCLFSFLATSCQKAGVVMNEDDQIALRASQNFPKLIPLPNGFHPEGIAVGKGTDFYVSSLNQGGIYKGDLRTGEGGMLVPQQPCLSRMSVGLSFDERSDFLFAAGGSYGNARVYDTKAGVEMALFQFVNPLNTPTMVNDVIVTREAAWFTDCFQPYLYKVPLGPAGQLPDPLTFEAVFMDGFYLSMIPPPYFGVPYNANGIDATPNGDYLVVVNLTTGLLYRVDADTGEALQIDLGGVSLMFGDGILLDGFTLYVVRNLLNMVAVIELSPDLLSGEVVGAITDPDLHIPSTIAAFGNKLYAVNARFDVAPPGQCLPEVEFEVVKLEKD